MANETTEETVAREPEGPDTMTIKGGDELFCPHCGSEEFSLEDLQAKPNAVLGGLDFIGLLDCLNSECGKTEAIRGSMRELTITVS